MINTLSTLARRAGYRIRYHWRHFVTFLGWCPDFCATLNFSTAKRPHCPTCGKFKP